MRVRLSLILFGLLSSKTAFGGSEACNRLLLNFKTSGVSAPKNALDPSLRVQMIINLLLRQADREVENAVTRAGQYVELVKTLAQKNLSLHSYLEHISSDDSRVVLDLPVYGEETLWDILTVAERKQLVMQLARIMKNGIYDKASRVSYDSPPKLAIEFVEEATQEKAGISPTAYLGRCYNHRTAGVCRHATSALAGILLELGISTQEIRMVSGQNKAHWNTPFVQEPKEWRASIKRHIWLEFRFQEFEKWMVIDPTPGGKDVVEDNRDYFSFEVKVHDIFFKPAS